LKSALTFTSDDRLYRKRFLARRRIKAEISGAVSSRWQDYFGCASLNSVYQANQIVNAAYGCADGGSGLQTCTGTVPSGSQIDTSLTGSSATKTFTVQSTDVVGNQSSQTVTYTVQAQSCHYVTLSIAPSTVKRGGVATVSASIKSCAGSAQTISENFTLTGPLGQSCSKSSTVMFTTPKFTLPPGTSKSVSFPFLIPKSACAGTYTTTATTLLGGSPIDSTSVTLTVQ